MTDIMRTGRALAEAVREKVRLERELSIVTARINTLSAEIMSAVTDEQDVPPMPRDFVSDFVSCPPECAEMNRHVHTPRGNVIRVLSSGDSL